jgi:hypothetical protein
LPGLDQAFDIGTIDPLRAHRAVCAYHAAFFDHTRRNRQAPLLERPSAAYPEVRFLPMEPRSPLRAGHDAVASTEVAPVGR